MTCNVKRLSGAGMYSLEKMNSRDPNNIYNWIERREHQANSISRRFQRALHVNPSFADRLGLTKELEGHNGCVNCLEWSQDGSLLVSGSDDFNIIVWEALKYRIGCKMNSGHSGNIFSVKFLPHSNNNIVASSAADAKVRLHNVSSRECTQVFGCHLQRVKRLAVSPHMPYMLWSGSEDGTVRQFDLRQPHSCSQSSRCANIIINLNTHIANSSEAKCIAINPLRPELIAVGSNDPFTRIYDTRMLSLHSIHDARGKSNGRKVDEVSPPPGCVSYFSPGHIPQRYGRDHPQKYRHYVVTYLSFSPDGQEILANLGGEHAYVFDIVNPREALKYSTGHICQSTNETVSNQPEFETEDNSNLSAANEDTNDSTKGGQTLSEHVLKLKAMGNENFSKQNYFQAVVYYNLAIELAPRTAVLYANRAAALLKRGWEGDIYGALSDCHVALSLDPEHSKAHYRQARCLYELQWYQEAMNCLNDFKYRFPEQAEGYSAKKLERDIRLSAVNEAEGTDDNNSNGGSNVSKRRRRRPHPAPSEAERLRQENAWDYKQRFVGACNTTTDIKEAVFFGQSGQFIVAGSDCGCMFLWNRATTNLIEAWHGDESIVNCLQPHPSLCMLATSGIDPVVRLWTPLSKESGIRDPRREKELGSLVRANQKRMNADPLEVMLMNMGYRARIEERTGDSDDESTEGSTVQCRTH